MESFKSLNAHKLKWPENKVFYLCRKCRHIVNPTDAEKRKIEVKAKEAEAKLAIAKTSDALVNALSRPTKRNALQAACPEPVDALNIAFEQGGGINTVFGNVGEALTNVLKEGTPDSKLKASQVWINFLLQTKKLEAERPDLSQFSDDDLFSILQEPAKHMLLTDAEFRKELLNDPEVREALLGELGVELVESNSGSIVEAEYENSDDDQ